MAALQGVAMEWEDSRTIRAYVRKHKKLIQPLQGDDNVFINLKTAGVNYDLLKPLVIRLKDSTGEIKMHSIRDITGQSLLLNIALP